jgi:TonB-dependent SusC/RagA subfamily outer membrane receptor
MPDEIESVTVLKGPDSAIYGIRAANGVIIVKTNRY